jgi:hypothetical protein
MHILNSLKKKNCVPLIDNSSNTKIKMIYNKNSNINDIKTSISYIVAKKSNNYKNYIDVIKNIKMYTGNDWLNINLI